MIGGQQAKPQTHTREARDERLSSIDMLPARDRKATTSKLASAKG